MVSNMGVVMARTGSQDLLYSRPLIDYPGPLYMTLLLDGAQDLVNTLYNTHLSGTGEVVECRDH
jgi:hypothetical protein